MVIDFDGLETGGTSRALENALKGVEDPAKDFNWTGWALEPFSVFLSANRDFNPGLGNSNYVINFLGGDVTSPKVALTRAERFRLLGVDMNGFMNDHEVVQTEFDFSTAVSVQVTGLLEGKEVWSRSNRLAEDTPPKPVAPFKLIEFDFSGTPAIDTLLFEASCGPCDFENPVFVLDNLSYEEAVIPVPAPLWLLGSAFLGMLPLARRR